jgi:CMP-N-acetylneuraminic acid synthetase
MEIPETEVQDIDNETDWQIGELKYKFLHDI